ncbi:MAG: hypothetical protein H7837_09625 [Magnetococcus sp. MYC-9]
MKRFIQFLCAMALVGSAAAPLHAAEPLWAPIAEKIGQALAAGETLYQAGDAEAAQKKVQGVYFGVFEAEKMEAAMRQALGNAHTDAVEKEFAAIRKAMKNKAKPEAVAGMVEKLVATLRQDARQLDADGVARPVEKPKK